MGREPRAWSLRRDSRTGTYTVRFRLHGQRCHRSTGERTAREAARAAQEIYDKESSVPTESVRPARGDLEGLIADWLTDLRAVRSAAWADTLELYAATHWLSRWAKLGDLTGEAIQQYIGERLRSRGRSGGRLSTITIRKELSGLSRFLT
jgi:hypothetical protein